MAQIIPVKWQSHPHRISIKKGEIDIWRFQLNKSPCQDKSLDEAESGRLHAIKNEITHRRYCASHTVLRNTLSRYLETAPADIQLVIGSGGKPRLKNDLSGIHFNMSHSGNYVLIAITQGHEIGIDIELVRKMRNTPQIAKRILSQDDVDRLAKNRWSDEFFFRLWTKMEARQKCFGEGIFGLTIKENRIHSHEFLVTGNVYAAVAWPVDDTVTKMNFYSGF